MSGEGCYITIHNLEQFAGEHSDAGSTISDLIILHQRDVWGRGRGRGNEGGSTGWGRREGVEEGGWSGGKREGGGGMEEGEKDKGAREIPIGGRVGGGSKRG